MAGETLRVQHTLLHLLQALLNYFSCAVVPEAEGAAAALLGYLVGNGTATLAGTAATMGYTPSTCNSSRSWLCTRPAPAILAEAGCVFAQHLQFSRSWLCTRAMHAMTADCPLSGVVSMWATCGLFSTGCQRHCTCALANDLTAAVGLSLTTCYDAQQATCCSRYTSLTD